MRRLARALLLLLYLYGSACAALTEVYVDLTATGTGHAGTTADPLSWEQLGDLMEVNGTTEAGKRFNIRGSITLTATDTWLADGTAASPIVLRGCYGTGTTWTPITPSRTNGSGALVTTNHPVITYNGNYLLNAAGSQYVTMTALKIASACTSNATLVSGFYSVVHGCSVTNSGSNAAAKALFLRGYAVNCDLACSGATTGACVTLASYTLLRGCVISDSASYGVNFPVTVVSPAIIGNIIYGCTDYAIYNSAVIASHQGYRPIICDNTIYGKGYGSADAAYVDLVVLLNNHITDGSSYAVTGPAVNSTPVLLANNRTRDNTSGAISWNGDWDEATTFGHVTTDDGGPNTDFVDINSSPPDLRLLRDAAGVGKGLLGSDIGAIQRPDPSIGDPTYLLAGATAGDVGQLLYGNVTLPLEANVWYGSGAFGARYLYLGYRLGTIGTDGVDRYFTSYRSTLPAGVVVGSWLNINGKYARIANVNGAELRLDNVAGDFPANGTGYMAGFYMAIAGSTPAMRASDITVTNGAAATLTAPDIKLNVVVDDLTGTYGSGSVISPINKGMQR